VSHDLSSPEIEEGEDKHPDEIDEVPVETHDPVLLVKKPLRPTSTSPRNTLRAMMSRKMTPIVTCVPWKPVIMKKHDPNWAAPHGFPQGRTPSVISLVHSKACIPTKVAPNAAVSSIREAVFMRSRRYPKLTAIAIVPLLLIRTKVMIAMRRSGSFVWPISREKTSLELGHGTVVDIRAVMYEVRKQPKMKVSLRRKIHIMAFPHDTCLNAR
jgi:hypothetical protein